MALFKKINTHDDYMTPKFAWEHIQHLIPKDKILWEAFYGNGQSGTYLEELGFQTIHEDIDFFKHDKGDIVVSNPPFSKCKEILRRLKDLEKPFILILPSSKINTQYFREIFLNEDPIQLIVPKKRIDFDKMVDGVKVKPEGGACFDCFYYCWKIDLQRDITWIN